MRERWVEAGAGVGVRFEVGFEEGIGEGVWEGMGVNVGTEVGAGTGTGTGTGVVVERDGTGAVAGEDERTDGVAGIGVEECGGGEEVVEAGIDSGIRSVFTSSSSFLPSSFSIPPTPFPPISPTPTALSNILLKSGTPPPPQTPRSTPHSLTHSFSPSSTTGTAHARTRASCDPKSSLWERRAWLRRPWREGKSVRRHVGQGSLRRAGVVGREVLVVLVVVDGVGKKEGAWKKRSLGVRGGGRYAVRFR